MANTMDTTNSIPEEILFEILTMLPVKSLCRFRCVSKHWLSIISDPNFVAIHLSRSKSRPKLLISVTRGKYFSRADHSTSFYSVEYPEKNHDQSSSLHATTHGSIEFPSSVAISVSETGLICCNCLQGIRIENPITGEFDLIHRQYPSVSNKLESVRSYIGFDPIDERTVILKFEDDGSQEKTSVFPLLKRQWHDTPHQPYIRYFTSKSNICMNGVVYITAGLVRQSQNPQLEDCLFAFNVKMESFEMIQLPTSPSLPILVYKQVIEYKGCVALILPGSDLLPNCPPKEDEIRLWILEDPKKHTWSYKTIVVPWRDTDNLWRLRGKLWERTRKYSGVSHKGELMFATQVSTRGSIELFLYDVDTNTLRGFQVDGLAPISSPRDFGEEVKVRVKFLIESLHSPKKCNSSISFI